jgi:hypothetical protein
MPPGFSDGELEGDPGEEDDPFAEPDESEPGSGEPWVSYSAARAGWRKRVLRVRVRSDGAVPELVLIARPGTRPPTGWTDGQVLARLPACAERATRTMDVRLEGALLPWGIRLLAVPEGSQGVEIDHPADDALILR